MMTRLPLRSLALAMLACVALLFACLCGCRSAHPLEKQPVESPAPTPPPATAAPNTPPQRADYSGLGAGVRYRKDVTAWADGERARQGIAGVPRKIKGNGNVVAPHNTGTLNTTTAAAKNTAAAAPRAQALAAKGAEQAALAAPGATITQAPAPSWLMRWRQNLLSLAGVGAFVWLVIALIRRFNRSS